MAGGPLTAKELQEKHADLLLQPPFSEATTPYYLHQALTQRQPPIVVSHGTVKQWWKTYKLPASAEPLKTAQEFEDKHGQSKRHLAVDYPTAYKLVQALRKRDPPIFLSDGIAKQWLQKFAGHDQLHTVLHF